MTEETMARNQDVKEAKIDGYMLPVTSVYVKMASNGKEVVAYKLLDKPLLYKYAERLKQIITVPFELLNIKGASDTEDVTVLKNYLLRRIELMKNGNNNVESYNISYKKIYELLNVSEQNSVSNNAWYLKTSDIRKTVKEILDYWKEIRYISKYSEYIDSKDYKNMGGIIIDVC
jgi:hypothetical protein